MRKILLLCVVVCFVSCGNKEIKDAAYNYNYAVANYHLDEAEQYCTLETSATLLNTARNLMQFVDSSYIASDTPATIVIVSVRQMSDTTAYVVYHMQTPIRELSDTLEMRKRDGRWLAHSPIIKNNADAQ